MTEVLDYNSLAQFINSSTLIALKSAEQQSIFSHAPHNQLMPNSATLGVMDVVCTQVPFERTIELSRISVEHMIENIKQGLTPQSQILGYTVAVKKGDNLTTRSVTVRATNTKEIKEENEKSC